jgi:hypothetical protein
MKGNWISDPLRKLDFRSVYEGASGFESNPSHKIFINSFL